MSKRPIIWNSGSTQHYFLGHWVNWLITLYCHSRSFYGNNTLTPWFLFILDSVTPTNEETVKNEASASGNSQPERNTGSNKNASGCPTLFARSNC